MESWWKWHRRRRQLWSHLPRCLKLLLNGISLLAVGGSLGGIAFAELSADWDRLHAGRIPAPIEPLK
jgi:hypothetical protein